MAESVLKHLEKIDRLQEEVNENAEKILRVIDLDKLLKDPQEYLRKLGIAFLSEHIDEIEKGAKQGEKFAKEVLKDV